MSNLQTYYFKLDFQKVDQHTGGKWLIHGTKRRKVNQLQSLELPCRITWNIGVVPICLYGVHFNGSHTEDPYWWRNECLNTCVVLAMSGI